MAEGDRAAVFARRIAPRPVVPAIAAPAVRILGIGPDAAMRSRAERGAARSRPGGG